MISDPLIMLKRNLEHLHNG